MFEYINLFLDYLAIFPASFSLLAVLFATIKYAVLGFVVSLVLVVVCVKFKVFRRQNKYWNFAAKLYYLFIPVVCITTGAAFGFLQYGKNISNGVVNGLLQPIKQEVVVQLKNLPPEIQTIDLQTIMMAGTAVLQLLDSVQFKGSVRSSHETEVKFSLLAAWLLKFLINSVIDELNTKAASAIGIDKAEVSASLKKNVVEIFESNFLNDILSQRIHSTIHSYQKMLLLIVFLFLLIPTIDFLIAKKLEKYRHNNVDPVREGSE